MDPSGPESAKGPESARAVRLFLYGCLVLVPPALVFLGPHSGGWELATRVAGVAALTIVTLQFLLAARIPWFVSGLGNPTVLRLHRLMGMIALLFVCLHLGSLVLKNSSWEMLTLPAVAWPVQVGRAAAIVLLLSIVFAIGRKWIPIKQKASREGVW